MGLLDLHRGHWHPSIAEWCKHEGMNGCSLFLWPTGAQNYNSHGNTFHLTIYIPRIKAGKLWDRGMDKCKNIILITSMTRERQSPGICYVTDTLSVCHIILLSTVQCHSHWLSGINLCNIVKIQLLCHIGHSSRRQEPHVSQDIRLQATISIFTSAWKDRGDADRNGLAPCSKPLTMINLVTRDWPRS